MIEFIDFEFTLKHPNQQKDDDCVELGNNGMLELEHELTGLCSPPELKFRPRQGNEFNIPTSMDATCLHLYSNYFDFSSIFNGYPISPEDCYEDYNIIDEYGNPHLVPKCDIFDLEITFFPCEPLAQGDPICPPLTITQDFKICCVCEDNATEPSEPGEPGGPCTICE